MPILVDKGRCILCNVCESLAPRIFKQKATVFVEQSEATADPDRVELCRVACPTQAIYEE